MKHVIAALVTVTVTGCGGTLPETRYYQLAPAAVQAPRGEAMLALEPLSTDGAYDDDRIVYRTSPYELDYYQYHRWSASPGVIVANFFEQALERGGRFRAVVREPGAGEPVLLGGRVIALEEVDEAKTKWVGHVALELRLTDAVTGESLWSEKFDETEPVVGHSVDGLARALSIAMQRIATRAAPIVSDLAERQARVHAEHPGEHRAASR